MSKALAGLGGIKPTPKASGKAATVSSGSRALAGLGLTPAVAPTVGQKPSENALTKALNILGKPGSALFSLGMEAESAAKGRGFSPSRLKQNVGKNFNPMTAIAEANPQLGAVGQGVGFLGAVVTDPLSALGGASGLARGGQGVMRQLENPAIREGLAKLGYGDEAIRGAQTSLLQKGVQGTDQGLMDALSQITGKSTRQGVYVAGGSGIGELRLPGTGGLARASERANMAARKAFVSSAGGAKVSKLFSGKNEDIAQLKVDARKGDINAWHKVEASRAAARAEKAAEHVMTRELKRAMKPFKGADADDMRRALEGDMTAAIRLESKGIGADKVAGVRKWLDDAADRVGIPRLENYFPRQMTKEMRLEMKKSLLNGADFGPAMKRELVDGAEFMGETLRGTPQQIREQIETILKQRWGDDYIKMFNDNPHEVLAAYTKQIARREAKLAAAAELSRRIGMATDSGVVAQGGAASRGAAGSPSTLPDVSRAPASAGRQVADDMPASTLQGPDAKEFARVGAVPAEAPRPQAQDVPRRGRETLSSEQTARVAAEQIKRDELIRQRNELAEQFDAAQVVSGPSVSMTPQQMQQRAMTLDQLMYNQTDRAVMEAMQREAISLRMAAAEDIASRTMDPIRRQSLEDSVAGYRQQLDALGPGPGTIPSVAGPSRGAELQRRIADLDREIAGLSGERRLVQQEAREELLEAVRLEEIAGFESAPEMAAKARLESQAAKQRADLGRPGKNTEAKTRAVLNNGTQLHNLVADSVRKLASGDDIDELADILTRTSRLNTTEGQRSLLRGYDALNNFLKRYQILSPGFHIRNAFGGEFNNWLAGVDRGAKYEWRQIWVKSGYGTKPERLNKAQREIFDWVESAGVFGNQATDVADEAIGRSWNPFAKNFRGTQRSRDIGGGVEGMLRGELANHIRRKGGTIQDAFDDVAKFHFDYDDLTGFERNVMKRIIPFYTWTRKNMPLQLEQIAKQPAKYTAYIKAKTAIENLSEEEGVYPEYYDNLMSIRLPKGVSQMIPGMGDNMAYIAPDLPFRDVAEYLNPAQPTRGLDMLKSAGAVPLKLPLELQAGRKFFNDQPFYEGWQKAPGSWKAMPGLLPALAALGIGDRGANGEYYMDQRDAYKVEQLMPALARIRRMAPSGEGDEFLQERQMTSILSTNLGIGIRANTPAAQKAELSRRTKKEKAAARRQRDLGYIP